MRIRRSGRRSAADSSAAAQATGGRGDVAGDQPPSGHTNEINIFDVALVPDDYRPGTRNKKLDTVACSSAGLVVAGSSTGEIFCWKLQFSEIARRIISECYKYLGQFKICKNAGV